MITVVKKFEFEASHKLPDESIYGKCANLHGHTYKLEVEVARLEFNEEYETMVINFSDLKEIVNKTVIDKYDHTYLNEFWKFPTAETMIRTIAKDLKEAIKEYHEDMVIVELKLYETTNSYAKWKNEAL